MTSNKTNRHRSAEGGDDVARRDCHDRSIPELVYIAVCLLALVAVAVVWLA